MTDKQEKSVISVDNNDEMQQLLGRFDQHLTLLDRYFNVRIFPQGNDLVVEGEPEDVRQVTLLFHELLCLIRQGQFLLSCCYAIEVIRAGQAGRLRGLFPTWCLSHRAAKN